MNELNARIVASNPWTNIDKQLDQIIDKVILEMNPSTPDDKVVELMEEWDNRAAAIEYLVEKLEKMKGQE